MRVHLYNSNDNRTLPRYPVARLVGHAEGPVPLVVFNGSSLGFFQDERPPIACRWLTSVRLVVDDDSILALGQKAWALTTPRMLFLHFELKLPFALDLANA